MRSSLAAADLGRMIPYSSLIADDIVVCKGGELLMTWELSGIPYEGISPAHLRAAHESVHRAVLSMKAPDNARFAFWFHERRQQRRSVGPESINNALSPMSQWVQAANCQMQTGAIEIRNWITVVYRPGAREYLAAKTPVQVEHALAKSVKVLREATSAMEQSLAAHRPRRLGAAAGGGATARSELLGFLRSIIGAEDEPQIITRMPIHSVLSDVSIDFDDHNGTWVQRGLSGPERYGAMIQFKEYPDATVPGLLNRLKQAPIEYQLTLSFSPMGREQSLRVLQRARNRLWSVGDKAISQIQSLAQAMDTVGSGDCLFGELHASLAVTSHDRRSLDHSLGIARSILTETGIIPVREAWAPVASYFAQLPGNWQYRPRTIPASSLNFVGLAGIQGEWLGKSRGNPWGASVATFPTRTRQNFHFSFHASADLRDCTGESALGNTLIIGKSGTGKTALVNFLLANVSLRSVAPRIVLFDKDLGSSLFVRACGGRYIRFSAGEPTGLNPLALLATPENLAFQEQWIRALVSPYTLTASEAAELPIALRTLASASGPLRRISSLQKLISNTGNLGLHYRLGKWTIGNPLGWVFDEPATAANVFESPVTGIDLTDLLDCPEVRVPVMLTLLHDLEQKLDGSPMIYAIDEFWKVLDAGPELTEYVKNKQKTIRKQNGLGVFATQSPEDALRSPIAKALTEQMATLILLPNPGADRDEYIAGLKLTDSEFALLQSLGERSRQFVVKQNDRAAVCTLRLEPDSDLLTVLAGNTESVRALEELERRGDPDAADPRLWSRQIRNTNVYFRQENIQ